MNDASLARWPRLPQALGRLAAGLALFVFATAGFAAESPSPNAPPTEPTYKTQTLRGKVVWLDEALRRLYHVATEPDAEHTAIVLETAEGELLPIVPDTRGRAFLVDERLRDVEFELLVRRYDKLPLIQVIRLRRQTEQGQVEVDYWCDICAIPMYIKKPCECCQGETRLRERPVEEVFEPK